MCNSCNTHIRHGDIDTEPSRSAHFFRNIEPRASGSDNFVFVGYVPKSEQEPDNLGEMLDAEMLLLKSAEPARANRPIPQNVLRAG